LRTPLHQCAQDRGRRQCQRDAVRHLSTHPQKIQASTRHPRASASHSRLFERSGESPSTRSTKPAGENHRRNLCQTPNLSTAR
jgi:hypothetical protein